MKYLPLLLILFAACNTTPQKVYSSVEIGMPYLEFDRVCGILPDRSRTITNADSETKIVSNDSVDFNGNSRPFECVGQFTFENDKLTTIER